MQKLPLLLVGLLFSPAGLFAQKPPLDTTTFTRWLGVADPAISPNGAYALYTVRDPHSPTSSGRVTLIIQALKGHWKLELPGLARAVFTDDSRRVVGLQGQGNDSLHLLTLGSSAREAIPHVRSFRLLKQGRAEWLVYQVSTPDQTLVLRNLATGKADSVPGVREYVPSPDGRTVVLRTEAKQEAIVRQSLSWVSLADGHRKVVWEGTSAGNLVLDAAGTQLAFVVDDAINGQSERSVWYYQAGAAKAMQLIDYQAVEIDGLQVDRISKFSQDGRRLFGQVKERTIPRPNPTATKLNVWSYTDAKLQPEQLRDIQIRGPARYAVVIPLNDPHRLIRLQRAGERPVLEGDDYLILENERGRGSDTEWYWNVASLRSQAAFYAVSTRTGERTTLKLSSVESLSPAGKYVIGWDAERAHLYSHEVATGVRRNLTQALPIPMGKDEDQDMPGLKFRWLGVAAWLVNDAAVLIYDRFDLWQVDPAGAVEPINLTNGYGRRNNIIFRLSRMYDEKAFRPNDRLVVSAFNRRNKDHGFFRVIVGKQAEPELLTMGPFVYGADMPDGEDVFSSTAPVKARDAEVHLVQRGSVTQSPNYFWTTDFKHFELLSAVYPERAYNWLTSELVTFQTLDGRAEQGVLYKPENFDPQKKYPVIFNYYDKKSQELNKYRRPRGVESNGEINVSWFASHGYLVFTPDIHYAVGRTGESIVNAVVGAAQHLAKFPWVDAKHMGIQGQSFGGYATNYLVTHSQLFAAAVSGAGQANLISAFGDIWFSGQAQAEYLEVRRVGMGATLWEQPDRYIQNSPIFNADKVTTPVLMMHNRNDGNVRFHHGVEFFLALRRLGKRAWLLEYDDGGHDPGRENAVDYTRRITQFFDHYLKGVPAPKWMTRGIPARLKGIDDGFELDREVPTPGPGLVADSLGAPETTAVSP